VLDAAAEVPERPAILCGPETITFADLARRVRSCLAYLASRHASERAEDPVALVGASDLATLTLVYALIEAGRPVGLVHPKLSPAERKPILDLFSADRVLDARTASLAAPSCDGDVPRARPDDERCLAVVFTSGTTGRPKGIVLSRRAFTASAMASELNLGFRDGDRWLLGLPIAHVGGLSILTRCLIARRTVVVPSEVAQGRRLDAAGIARAIDEHGVTLVSLVPTQLEWLLSATPSWRPPEHLRAVLLGGAPARPALLGRAADLGVPVLTTYGCTEACSQVTTQPYGTRNRGELGSGTPLHGTEVRIADDGAIQVRGPTLFSGYFPDGATVPLDAAGWFTTDDVGRLDDRGMLHVVGRRSECIITGGENVFPTEVEASLERCPGVGRACVFAVPDDTWGEVLAVAVVPSGDPNPSAIVRFSRAELAPHRRPRFVAFVGALCTNDTGKLDRRATAAHARQRLERIN